MKVDKYESETKIYLLHLWIIRAKFHFNNFKMSTFNNLLKNEQNITLNNVLNFV